jgi:hypothetical protein
MESLAIVIIFLFSIALFAGPIAILLTANVLTTRLTSKNEKVFKFIDFIRRIFIVVLVTLASIVGFQFLTISQLPFIPRATGLFALITSYIALRREFFPKRFIVRSMIKKMRIGKKDQG